MQGTVELARLGRLPALVSVTRYLLLHFFDVLPEVQTLLRKKFSSNRRLKIFVAEHAILIKVKLFEHVLELIFRHLDSPEVQVELKLFLADSSTFALVEVHECFSDGLPLELHFFQDHHFKVFGE